MSALAAVPDASLLFDDDVVVGVVGFKEIVVAASSMPELTDPNPGVGGGLPTDACVTCPGITDPPEAQIPVGLTVRWL